MRETRRLVEDVERSRLLLDFNEWANLRILAAAEKLSPEDYTPLVEQFAHMMGAQRWYARCSGIDYGKHAVPMTIEDLRIMLGRSHDDLREFAATLTAERLASAVAAPAELGEFSVEDSIVQLVNHGTQHRSEIALVLTERGCSPGDLDYLFFRLGR